jgi:glutamate-1-semialdehyde 2,1-aminomutase
VITGFRVGLGGYQAYSGVMPDLTCLGKVVGGGMPVGAYGGRREVMQQVAPLGPVYQAGTLSGNPLAMAAGIATLKQLAKPGFFDELEEKAAGFADGIDAVIAEHEIPARLSRVGSMMTLFFSDEQPRDYAGARKADAQRYARFFHALLDSGVYFPPSQYEAAFVSAAHSDADLDSTVQAISAALAAG